MKLTFEFGPQFKNFYLLAIQKKGPFILAFEVSLGQRVNAWIWDLVLLGFDFIVYGYGILAPSIGIWGLNLEI